MRALLKIPTTATLSHPFLSLSAPAAPPSASLLPLPSSTRLWHRRGLAIHKQLYIEALIDGASSRIQAKGEAFSFFFSRIPLQLFIVAFQVVDVTRRRKRLIKSRWLRLRQTQSSGSDKRNVEFPPTSVCLVLEGCLCLLVLNIYAPAGARSDKGQTNSECGVLSLESVNSQQEVFPRRFRQIMT